MGSSCSLFAVTSKSTWFAKRRFPRRSKTRQGRLPNDRYSSRRLDISLSGYLATHRTPSDEVVTLNSSGETPTVNLPADIHTLTAAKRRKASAKNPSSILSGKERP